MSNRSRISRGDLLRVLHLTKGKQQGLETAPFSTGYQDTGKRIVPLKHTRKKTNEIPLTGEIDFSPLEHTEATQANANQAQSSSTSYLVPLFAKAKPVSHDVPKKLFKRSYGRVSEKDLAVDWSAPGLPHAPLLPWSRLWPYLKNTSLRHHQSRKPDLNRLVRQLANLKLLGRLPYQTRETWSDRWLILMDKRAKLKPFWRDMDDLVSRLADLRGKEGLQCYILPEGHLKKGYDFFAKHKKPVQVSLPEATPVLLLSDLGQLDQDSKAINYWLSIGEKLNRVNSNATALVPCPRDRWNARLARCWGLATWDRLTVLPHNSQRQQPTASKENKADEKAVQYLLNALAPTMYINPELLRKVRFLFPHCNVGHEYDAWHHSEITHLLGKAALDSQSASIRLPKFQALKPDIKDDVAKMLIEGLYQGSSPLLQSQVKLVLALCGIAIDSNEKDMLKFHQKAVETMAEKGSSNRLGLSDWYSTMFPRLPASMRKNDVFTKAWAVSYYHNFNEESLHDTKIEIPNEIDLELARKVWDILLERSGLVCTEKWQLLLKGNKLLVQSDSEPASLRLAIPLGELPSSNNRLEISHLNREKRNHSYAAFPKQTAEVSVADVTTLNLSTDNFDYSFQRFTRPEWAKRMGYDRFGLYADLEVKEVRFRLRWIPPGRFMMGAPESETGRDKNETQHEVTITRGYWMAETQTTQALWEAVMGKNPSKSEGQEQPVDSVNWQDCLNFCKRLEKSVLDSKTGKPALTFSLPTEAQWEYACRAGTSSAFNDDSDCTNPDGDDTALANLGWHGEGHEGNTHPVKSKLPNAWGLYDMHGNVDEWCQDWYKDYSEDVQSDPIGPDNGRYRVLRGGCFWYLARYCRSAYRLWRAPSSRSDLIGFRLAAGQLVSSSQPGERSVAVADKERGKVLEGETSEKEAKASRSDRVDFSDDFNEGFGNGEGKTPSPKMVGLWDNSAQLPWPWEERSNPEDNPAWADPGSVQRDKYGLKAVLTVNGVSFVFRQILPDTFNMGSPEDETGRTDNEELHSVTLTRGFWLMETPVTQRQYTALFAEGKIADDSLEHPQGMSWEDCTELCDELNQRVRGLDAALPTEAEWEYVCRAGTTTAFNDGSDCTEPEGKDPALDKLGWFAGNSGHKVHPVGEKRPNLWGLKDMHGNVWEWCHRYSVDTEVDPKGPESGQNRVLRGGCYWSNAWGCRSAYRGRNGPSDRSSSIGFRLAAGHFTVSSGRQAERGMTRQRVRQSPRRGDGRGGGS